MKADSPYTQSGFNRRIHCIPKADSLYTQSGFTVYLDPAKSLISLGKFPSLALDLVKGSASEAGATAFARAASLADSSYCNACRKGPLLKVSPGFRLPTFGFRCFFMLGRLPFGAT